MSVSFLPFCLASKHIILGINDLDQKKKKVFQNIAWKKKRIKLGPILIVVKYIHVYGNNKTISLQPNSFFPYKRVVRANSKSRSNVVLLHV